MRTILSVIAIMVVVSAGVALTAAATPPHHILLLYSYHPTFNTYGPMMEGIESVLEIADSKGVPISLDVEFLDSKRLPTAENLASFRDRLAMKLDRMGRPDLVMVSDDNAFRFVLAEQERLFADTPIVFLGVNDRDLAMKQNANDRITGVVERARIDETLGLAAQIAADSGRIHVIVDATTTGHLLRRAVDESPVLASDPSRFNILSLDDLSYAELAEILHAIGPDCSIVLMTGYRDKLGETKSIKEIAGFIRDNSPVPFVHPWSSSLGAGSLGGKVISHLEQGRRAAEIGVAILSGASPADFPVVDESPAPYLFDRAVLERFAIDPKTLPEDARFINAPASIMDTYREWIIAASVFLLAQSVVIVLLSVNTVRRRTAERERAKSEERFRDMLEGSTDWYWETDEDLQISFVSDRFESMTGEKTVDRLGTGLLAREPKERTKAADAAYKELKRRIAERRPFRAIELPFVKTGGGIRFVRMSGTPMFENGAFTGYRGTGTEITEEVEARHRLDQALRDLQRTNEAKSAFLANISHELRTPLNAVNGMSEAMSLQVFGPLGSDQYLDYAQHINEAGRHLQTILDNVLDAARIEAGAYRLDEQEIEIEELLDFAETMFRGQAEAKGLTFDIRRDPGVHKVLGDSARLHQILTNLIDNAIKFTPDAGSVRIDARLGEAGEVEIAIQDTGCGIAEADLERVVLPYEQIDTPFTSTEGGIGLGLPLAKMLAELHGGSLTLDSREGVGTTVIFALPWHRHSGA